jgi:hypothetical protein
MFVCSDCQNLAAYKLEALEEGDKVTLVGYFCRVHLDRHRDQLRSQSRRVVISTVNDQTPPHRTE